ncbi:MAG: zinc-ribbon domain containing protein [Dehalococcoidales bacterium]|jgi:CxxC-x17-CxxC domain-containing protein|nr:zinc-ribbon domain containing protein [Dehalococcoidales bacterium]
MSFQDKSLTCADCGATFTFSADEQELFQTRGYLNEPKRCPTCRQAKRTARNGSSDSSSSFGARRNMFTVTCSACGKSTEVPFEPRGDRPVYCSDCYRKVRVNR